ncbi:hypothetical protein M0R45_029084 [Rubus argutus]|uniref:NB-ARC domain-containing protein n=1 Tax=Rubus argutus TaxID=59490 RepID=A0AAW1W6Y0_RUBAR
MGGLGKTTLAKCVYHDDKIEQHFQEKIWVCVSTPFEVNSILRGILESLKPKNAAVQAIDAMCRILKEKLKEKRYLLVLDDVWNEDAQKWDDLISRLSRVTDTQGATILVTTRSDKAAKIVENLPRSRENWQGDCKKCGGVPLMAKVLGEKSFFQDVTTDGRGNIIYCKMHDLVHDLAESVSKSKNLRSLFSKGEALGSTLPRFKALRVLNLYEADIQELPISRKVETLEVGEETAGPGIEELGGLNQLKDTLSIYGLENVRDGEEAQKANLAEKKHIEGFMGVKFPSWLFLSNNLKEIELFECNKCEGVPILGHLPNLVHVKMMRMENLKCLGSEFYGYDHVSMHAKAALFPALKN